MSNSTIAFIGAGNMASSIIGGLVTQGLSPASITATARSQASLTRITNIAPVNTTTDNQQAVIDADVVVLAVKPQMMKTVLEDIKDATQSSAPLFISLAAGIEISSIDHWLGGNQAIIRCMPNTPSMVQQGAAGLYANTRVTAVQKTTAETILRAVGLSLWVDDEESINAVTAVSGSGPAYFFYIMEAMQAAGEELGLTTEAAKLLTLQTALGAAQMAIASDEDTAQLRRQVTSPGGTTEQAIKVFDENNLRDTFKQAMTACKNRAQALAKESDI